MSRTKRINWKGPQEISWPSVLPEEEEVLLSPFYRYKMRPSEVSCCV